MKRKYIRKSGLFSLTNRYIPAMLILALLAIINFFVNDYKLDILNKHGEIINKSGKQRMISQKSLLLTYRCLEGIEAKIKKVEFKEKGTFKEKFLTALPDNYSLNLATLYSMEEVEKFLTKHDISQNAFGFLFGKEKSHAKVMYGIYKSKDEAYKARSKLDRKLRRNNPTVEKIKVKQALYKKYHHKEEVVYEKCRVEDGDSLAKLKEILKTMKESNEFLVSNPLTEELEQIYFEEGLKKEVDDFISHLQNFVKNPSWENDYPYEKAEKLLVKLNKAVKLHEKHYESDLENIKLAEIVVLIGILTMLSILVVSIFIPTSRLIASKTKKLNEANTTLKDELKQRNKKLKELEETLSSYVIMITIDLNSNIIDVSEEFCKISGYERDELIGKPYSIIEHPDTPSLETSGEFWEAAQKGETFSWEVKNIAKDGSVFICESFVYPNFDNNGDVVSYTGLRKDITAKNMLQELNKNLEAEVEKKTNKVNELNKNLEIKVKQALEENTKQLQALQQQTKMASMGEMIGAIAHQWRQSLNALGANIQNLKYHKKEGKLEDEEFIKDFIEVNKKTISFMSKTIDDFRSFFRVDKEKSDFKIKETTQSVINMQSAQLKNYNIALNITGDEFLCNGFQSEYQQVILNIINNAKDALLHSDKPNPTIDIEINSKAKTINIKDNAGGIPENIISRIYEPYFTTKEQGKGTGMGLYMSKMIIEDNMGGNLNVENTNEGACFTIDFS